MKTRFLLVLFLLVSLGVSAQETDLNALMQQRGEYYFTFNLNGNDNLKAIAHAVSVDKVDGNVVTAYANNRQFAEFQELGYEVTLQTPPSMLENHKMYDGRTRATYDWDSYPTYEAYEAMMYEFATDHPDKCQILTLGTLNSGRKILVARLNNGVTEGKPKFLYSSTMHGDETTGYIMMLRLIDYLLENPTIAEVQNVMDNLDLFICPDANPDGTYHGGNNTVNGSVRYNASGIDLNRNYPDFNDGPHPDGEPYAPETEWFMQLAEDYQFTMAANYHGGSEVMNYPWDNETSLHADDAWWQYVCREYADLAHQVDSNYMTDLNNGITNGAQWYQIGGGRQDFMNYYHQCREVCIECSGTKCPSGSQMPSFWNYNHNSIFAYMNQCLKGIHGVVTDSISGQPIEATVTVVGHDQDYSVVESHLPAGDYHRPIKGGTYTVRFTANGYYPKEYTVTVVDGQTANLNVQLVAGEGIIAGFGASSTGVALGGTVDFTDESWGAGINSWSWEFEGATPSTSTVQNPTNIRYNEAGSFGVRLTVSNANGDTDTKYIPHYINVVPSFNMHNGNETTCGSMFYDTGGANGNYSDNENITMTIYPEVAGAKVKVEFSMFNTESGYDKLYVYDGTSASSASMGVFSGSSIANSFVATNDAGALTFKFTSDYSQNKAGWVAYVSCEGVVEPLVVEAYADNDTLCVGESMSLHVSAIGGSGNYTYQWSPAENLDDPTLANPLFTSTTAGEITCTVEVNDGENSETAVVVFYVDECLGVAEVSENDIEICPNPASSVIHINGLNEKDNVAVTLYNIQGQLVKEYNTLEINVEDVCSGVYFLNVKCEDRCVVRKVVIE